MYTIKNAHNAQRYTEQKNGEEKVEKEKTKKGHFKSGEVAMLGKVSAWKRISNMIWAGPGELRKWLWNIQRRWDKETGWDQGETEKGKGRMRDWEGVGKQLSM